MSDKLRLYHLTNEMLAILDADEVNEEMMEAAFANIVKKDAAACHFIKTVEASAAAMKEEAKRMADRAKSLENKAKWAKEYVQQCMERLDMDEIEAGTFKLRIQNNPPSLAITDKEAIPNAYRVIIPETWEPDNARIKDDLKAGKDIPGATLTQGRSLRIR